MKLKKVVVDDKELERVAPMPDDYKRGFFAGFVKGRDKQFKADKAMNVEL